MDKDKINLQQCGRIAVEALNLTTAPFESSHYKHPSSLTCGGVYFSLFRKRKSKHVFKDQLLVLPKPYPDLLLLSENPAQAPLPSNSQFIEQTLKDPAQLSSFLLVKNRC